MPSEPRWLSTDEIIWINEQQVKTTGEPHEVRDAGLLDSAVSRPKNHWGYGEQDVLCLAAYLLSGLAKNHSFKQGNKRTGAVAALMFLDFNGYQWTLPDNGELADWVERLVINAINEDELIELMRPHVR